MAPKLSIDVVAKAAGVHRSTVSRAFSKPEAVNQETREHILSIAQSLGYTMNPLAQALRRKASNLVPLIVPDITNPFFAELAKTMAAAAGQRGYQLMLCVTEDDQAQTEVYLHAMQAMYAPFGVIAPSTQVDAAALRKYEFGSRVIVVDRVDDPQIPTVTVDNSRGIELAFAHLTDLGHQRIGYVSGIHGTHTAGDRINAYRRLATEGGHDPLFLDDGVIPGAGQRAAEKLAGMDKPPTAVIAANDMVAFGLMSGLGDHGIRIPQDISVVGFDGLMLGERYNPKLTTVQQPIADMGAIAIDLAEALTLRGEVGHVVLEPQMLIRKSTAAPAR